jgi:Family of unknown function (DUF6520)
MKKIQMALVALAAVAGVGSAFATTTRYTCLQEQLYKLDNGTEPVTPGYSCDVPPTNVSCTFTSGGTKCQTGTYVSPHLLK